MERIFNKSIYDAAMKQDNIRYTINQDGYHQFIVKVMVREMNPLQFRITRVLSVYSSVLRIEDVSSFVGNAVMKASVYKHLDSATYVLKSWLKDEINAAQETIEYLETL